MSNNEVINTGSTQLYNQIYCNFLPKNSLGFNTCANCNFTDVKPFVSSKQSSENSCNTSCSNNPVCVGYTYNISSGNCDNFNAYPNVINYNSPGNNSGYSLNGTYDFNSLSSKQQDNIKVKCADQFLNNNFIKNNNVEIANCLKVSNSGSNTLLNVDPNCLYNIYQQNNIPVNQVNNSAYSSNNINKNTITDPTIDSYMSNYNSFTTADVQNINISNKMSEFVSTPPINNLGPLYDEYKSTMKVSSAPLNLSLKSLNRALGIELFENQNTNTINNLKFIPILLIIFIIFIILFYVFKKK